MPWGVAGDVPEIADIWGTASMTSVGHVPAAQHDTPAVVFERVSLAFDDRVVLREVSFTVRRGHMTVLLGASGVGKSVVLKLILGLLQPDSGVIRVDGERIDTMTERELMRVRAGIGMLFQESALFDSLTVGENVGYQLKEEAHWPPDAVRRRVWEVLVAMGLQEYADRLPSALSGGQRRRVAIARAVAARPHLLLFDDPTSGLDPITAKVIDAEIVKLRDAQHVTSIIVTHTLPDAFYIATHQAVQKDGRLVIAPAPEEATEHTEFVMLKDGRVYFTGSPAALRRSNDAYLRAFMAGWFPPLLEAEDAARAGAAVLARV